MFLSPPAVAGRRFGSRRVHRGSLPMTGIDLVVQSPAKINWSLRVLARREDGFHEIESLVSGVTFYDELTFTTRAGSGVELSCEHSDLPTDRRNLIVQAAMLLADEAGCELGVTCRLTKRIPVGGGLGGGSSNGASTLMALNRLWGLDWPTDRLLPLAAALGSDASFFLGGGSAVISGRGERIRPVELNWRGWIVLLLPGIRIPTAAVYRAWEPGQESPVGCITDAVARGEAVRADPAAKWMERTFNGLEKPVMKVCPAMRELIAGGTKLARRPVRVSGSGSALFTAFDTRSEAEQFARSAGEALTIQTRVVQPLEQVRKHV